MHWIVYERPKDAEPLTREKMDELIEDIKRGNARRRGEKREIVLQFKKPGATS